MTTLRREKWSSEAKRSEIARETATVRNKLNADDERDDGIGRVNALTDGVIAIAITLLALFLRPDLPKSTTSRELAHYLHEHVSQYGAFVIAFFLIAQYWVLHRRLMSRVQRTSPSLISVTLLFLFGITLIPLTASVTGDLSNDLALSLFAINVLLIGATAGVMAEIIRRQQLENFREGREERVRRHMRSVVSVLIPALVAATAWVFGGNAAYFFLLFIVAGVPGAITWRVVSRRNPSPAAG
jgi:uncharacterized membrane protein